MAEGAFCGRVATVVEGVGEDGAGAFTSAAAKESDCPSFLNTEQPVWVLSIMPNQMLKYMRLDVTPETRGKG